METRLSKRRKLESEEAKNNQTTSLFDLPMEMLLYLGKFLELKDIFKFRCYSRYSREVGNAMLSDLRKLIITNSFPRNKRQLLLLVQQCHSLRDVTILLSVNKRIITDKVIEDLWSNNPLLEKVLFGITGNPRITSKALIPLATKCKNLVRLEIRRLNPGNEFLEALRAHNSHLVKVDFDFYVNSEDQMETFWELVKNQPKLQHISLPDMWLGSPRNREIYEKNLFAITEVCKELTHLENLVIQSDGLRFLRKIVENCPKLKSILFASNVRVSGEISSYLRSKNISVIGGYSESDLDSDLDDEDNPYWNSDSYDEFYGDSDDSSQDYDSDRGCCIQ